MEVDNKEQQVTPKWKGWVLIFGGLILLLIMAQTMREAFAMQQASAARVKVPALSADVIHFTSDSLQDAFQQNTDAATKAYKDKTIVVTGNISEIDDYRTGESYLIFKNGNSKSDIDLQCVFAKEQKNDTLKKGQKVSVEGVLNFVNDAIVLENCRVVKQ